MKKIIAFMICMLIVVCAIPFSVYAEDIETTASETGSENETTESAIAAPEETAGETAEDGSKENLTELLSVKFKKWVIPHLEEISVIITLIGTAFYNMRKHKLLNQSIGTMNNNTVTIAEQSSNMMTQALTGMENTALAVRGYDERIEALLDAHKSTLEDKERLEQELSELKVYLKTSTQANIEFSNELAELLALANIPNYKKEEIGARHMAAVRSIAEIESEVRSPSGGTMTGEVITDDGEKA